MTNTPDAYPLQWPAHVARTKPAARMSGSFQVTPSKAMFDLVEEVRRSGGSYLVVSSNVAYRRDGLPYAKQREPDDPGVAVYFMRKGQQVCIACDTFTEVWRNVRAIGLSIRDMRGPETRGCASITDQAFRGFTALPPPDATFAPTAPPPRPWWDVLGVNREAPVAVALGAYKALARSASEADLYALNAAKEAAIAAKGGVQ